MEASSASPQHFDYADEEEDQEEIKSPLLRNRQQLHGQMQRNQQTPVQSQQIPVRVPQSSIQPDLMSLEHWKQQETVRKSLQTSITG